MERPRSTAWIAALLAGMMTAAIAVAAPGAATPSPPRPAAAGTAAAIKVLATERVDARTTTYTVSTPSLEMSAKVPLKVHVVLPNGYARHPDRRYPVLYALPGTSNKADVWLNNIDTARLTAGRPLIVVIPDGTYDGDGGGFYTDWVDQTTSRGVANWETFHTRELVGWVDRRFRTVADRSGRAIVGISQGGFGSMSYAARHPARYGAVASFSGAVDIYYGEQCRIGAALLIAGIMTGLNQVQPFAPFGDPVTNAANWRSRDPGSIVGRLSDTRIDLYTAAGLPGRTDLVDPAVPGTMAMEALLHHSNLCFKKAADAAGVRYYWHSRLVGTHAWRYGTRSLADYLPRLMNFFRSGR
ncbi:alpha/beta hydrolase family protein [Nocardioides sp. R-C-SC26]|uniref:alpha/beta hydrolase n=1 Tax=Nocardioides sp. R-C-SC26 TaxID=2870414 RepID=UPI001E55EA7E|nr:alpha/beta hydrolase family protein [Nocardioides sp. R-C-SC26]